MKMTKTAHWLQVNIMERYYEEFRHRLRERECQFGFDQLIEAKQSLCNLRLREAQHVMDADTVWTKMDPMDVENGFLASEKEKQWIHMVM